MSDHQSRLRASHDSIFNLPAGCAPHPCTRAKLNDIAPQDPTPPYQDLSGNAFPSFELAPTGMLSFNHPALGAAQLPTSPMPCGPPPGLSLPLLKSIRPGGDRPTSVQNLPDNGPTNSSNELGHASATGAAGTPSQPGAAAVTSSSSNTGQFFNTKSHPEDVRNHANTDPNPPGHGSKSTVSPSATLAHATSMSHAAARCLKDLKDDRSQQPQREHLAGVKSNANGSHRSASRSPQPFAGAGEVQAACSGFPPKRSGLAKPSPRADEVVSESSRLLAQMKAIADAADLSAKAAATAAQAAAKQAASAGEIDRILSIRRLRSMLLVLVNLRACRS